MLITAVPACGDLAAGLLAKYQIVKAVIDETGRFDYFNYPVFMDGFRVRSMLNAMRYS